MLADAPDIPEELKIAIYCPVRSAYADRLLEGALRYCQEHVRIRLRDFRYQDVGFRLPRRPPRWGGWEPHGILCNVGPQPGLAEWLKKTGVPIVNTTTEYPQDVFPAVHCTGAGDLAAAHLSAMGHEHFGFVGLEGRRGSQILQKTFTDAMARRGHPVRAYGLKVEPIAGDQALEEAAASDPGLGKFLQEAPKPLALFALDDDFARVVCRACHRLGLSIPGQVAVLGLEDTLESRTCDPPLSSIHPPGEEVGWHAVSLLHGLIRGEAIPREPLVVPITRLVERASTQCGRSTDPIMTQAKQLIAREGGRGIRVQDVATALRISRSLLQHRYVEQFGHTPGDAIAKARVHRAKQLLLESEMSITRISGMLGFGRSSIFGAFFKRHVGMTPTAFRKGGQRG